MDSKIKLLRDIGLDVQRGVVLTDVIMTLYCLWLIITDTSTWVPGILLGFTPLGSWLLYRSSKLFGFCITHKLMILHTLCVTLCSIYQGYIGFGKFLYPMRLIMFLWGFILFINILYGLKRNCRRISD